MPDFIATATSVRGVISGRTASRSTGMVTCAMGACEGASVRVGAGGRTHDLGREVS